MKRKFTILIVFFLCRLTGHCITEAPYLYYFKVVSKDSREEILNANVTIRLRDTVVGSGYTGKNGIAPIETTKKLKEAVVKVTAQGFKTSEIKGVTLKIKDTLTVILEIDIIRLDEMELITYQIPLTNGNEFPQHEGKQNKAVSQPTLVIEYTREELEAYAVLSKGFEFNDSIKGTRGEYNEWRKFIAAKIVWPDKVRDAGFEEKLYFQLTFDKKGTLQKVILLRGNDPALVYAVYKVLLLRPGVRYVQHAENEVTVVLPILFKIR